MHKNIKRFFLSLLIIGLGITQLTGCGGEDQEQEVDKLSAREQRYIGHKYDFLDYINLGISGANGVARIDVLELKEIKAKDFESEDDFVIIKQIFSKSKVSADLTENLKNGDIVRISLSYSGELTKKENELININEYEYEVAGLEKGKSIDLANDIAYNVYAFESLSDGKAKKESNSDYEMKLVAIPSIKDSKISADKLVALHTKATSDDAVFELGESVLSITSGYDKDYIINSKIMLKQLNKKTGLEPCTTILGGFETCAVKKDAILKKADVAAIPNFNTVDKEILKKNILSFVNTRFSQIEEESIALKEEDMEFDNFEKVVAIYKYNEPETERGISNEHSELNKYRYAVVLSTTNSENREVYCTVTFGMLQDGDYIGLFTLDTQYMNLIMIQAGYSSEKAIMPSESSQYTLSLETLFS